MYKSGPQVIPGKLRCAYFDLGGENVACHDEDAINHGNGELNRNPKHQREHASPYIWQFRENEGVDLSHVQGFADLNRSNLVTPEKNQFYIGWTKDGEWCNFTVDVKVAGTYKVSAVYGNAANAIKFSINSQPAAECRLPVATGFRYELSNSFLTSCGRSGTEGGFPCVAVVSH